MVIAHVGVEAAATGRVIGLKGLETVGDGGRGRWKRGSTCWASLARYPDKDNPGTGGWVCSRQSTLIRARGCSAAFLIAFPALIRHVALLHMVDAVQQYTRGMCAYGLDTWVIYQPIRDEGRDGLLINWPLHTCFRLGWVASGAAAVRIPPVT